ncbi:MAG: hypothetical protein P4L53_04785 [Candidatus Obscuribacterales bacterium]|nr:hypothetical protein [Candidatus Obscuribacterales bacterium]
MTAFLALLPVLILLALSLMLGLFGSIIGLFVSLSATVVDEYTQVNYGGKVFNVEHRRSNKTGIWATPVIGLALCVVAIALSLYHYQLLAYPSAFFGGIVLPGGVLKLLYSFQDDAGDRAT